MLISKIYEIWQFLECEKISEEKSRFSSNLLYYWNKIETFFSIAKNKELFCFVRNKFGFHFDHYQEIEKYIEKAMDEVGDLEFWMGSDSSGNAIMLIVLRNKMI
jgi:chloramphenicol O-acetyltransferase